MYTTGQKALWRQEERLSYDDLKKKQDETGLSYEEVKDKYDRKEKWDEVTLGSRIISGKGTEFFFVAVNKLGMPFFASAEDLKPIEE